MSAAKPTSSGKVSVRIYMDEPSWNELRHHAVDRNVSASAIVAALLEGYMARPAGEQAPTLERAREITLGRRRRAGP